MITQSGTDTDLSGLTGVSGVTTLSTDECLIQDMGVNRLLIDGTLTINGSDEGPKEMLIIGVNGATQFVDIDISSTGTLNVGRLASQTGVTYASERHWASIFEDAAIHWFSGNGKDTQSGTDEDAFLNVEGDGVLNWYGVINCTGGMRFKGVNDGTSTSESLVTIRGGVLDARRCPDRGSFIDENSVYNYSNGLDIQPPSGSTSGWTILTGERTGATQADRDGFPLVQLAEPIALDGYEVVYSSAAFLGSITSETDLTYTIENYTGVIGDTSANFDFVSMSTAPNTSIISFLNSRLGSTLVVFTNVGSDGYNETRALQEVRGTSTDNGGVNRVDGVVATEDKGGTVYSDLVPAGVYDLGALLLASWDGADPTVVTYNNPSDTNDDLWTIVGHTYLGVDSVRSSVRLRGEGGTVVDFVTADDPSITESLRATVDGYNGLSDLGQIYDRAKSFKIATANVAKPNIIDPIVRGVGSAVDFLTLDVILDGTTLTAFAYNDVPTPDVVTIGPIGVISVVRIGETETIVEGPEGDEIEVNFPVGTADGDLAYLIIGHSESEDNVWNVPSGWAIPTGLTEVITGGTPASVPGVSVFRRVLSSDSGSVTVTNAGTNISGIVGQMVVYRFVDNATPEDVNSTTASGSSGDPDPASITPVTDDSMIVAIGFADGSQGVSANPSGYSAILDTLTIEGGDEGDELGGPTSQEFTSTDTFVVPIGVTALEIKTWGTGGGGGAGGDDTVGETGGGGGFAHATAVAVTPGETLDIIIGTGGGGGPGPPFDAGAGGGGGGRTRVVRQTGSVNLSEGGAGGGGGGGDNSVGAAAAGRGGAGGTNTGETGVGSSTATGGGGGTQIAGGDGGIGNDQVGDNGDAGVGGDGASDVAPNGGGGASGTPGGGEGGLENGAFGAGGGGGAGFFGGGGGGEAIATIGSGTGGGGGSNLLTGTTQTNAQGVAGTGAGQLDGDYPGLVGDGGAGGGLDTVGSAGEPGAVVLKWTIPDRSLDGMLLATADFKQGTAAAENPGIFDTSESTEWGAITMALRVASAPAGPPTITATEKFDAITTTGKVTLDNNVRVDGITFNCDVVLADAAIDLTDVVINGNLSVTDGGTYAFDNVTVTGDVTNDDNTTNVEIIASNGSALSTSEPGAGITQVTIRNIVTVKVTVLDAATGLPIQTARVYLVASAAGSLPYQASVTIVRSGSTATVTHTAHALTTGQKVLIEGADQEEYNRIKAITVTGVNTYTYTVSGTPTTPATGTITSTGVVLDADTDAQGIVQTTTFNYSADTPVTGNVRKGTASPLYKSGLLSGDILSSGFVTSLALVGDE